MKGHLTLRQPDGPPACVPTQILAQSTHIGLAMMLRLEEKKPAPAEALQKILVTAWGGELPNWRTKDDACAQRSRPSSRHAGRELQRFYRKALASAVPVVAAKIPGLGWGLWAETFPVIPRGNSNGRS